MDITSLQSLNASALLGTAVRAAQPGFQEKLLALTAAADPASLSSALRQESRQDDTGEPRTDALTLTGSGGRTPQVEDLLAYRPLNASVQPTTDAGATRATEDAATRMAREEVQASADAATDAAVTGAALRAPAADAGLRSDSMAAALAGGSLVATQVLRYGQTDPMLGRNLDIVLAVSPASPASGFQGASRQANERREPEVWVDRTSTTGLADYA